MSMNRPLSIISRLILLLAPTVLSFTTTAHPRPLAVAPLQASSTDDPGFSRRQVGELTIAALGLGTTFLGTRENDPTEYGLWGILPVGPYKKKKTVFETIVDGKMWTLDQKFGILDVQVPLRMTVIRLSDGGLFIYNPIAATQECLAFVQDLVDQYGPVKYMALGSVALEHKVYAGVMAQKFPSAQVYVQPGQYSFPSNLPGPFLGFPAGRTFDMPATAADAPWKQDLEFLTLGPMISRDGAFGETVFFHKETKTLLVTDTVVEVSEDVPKIYEADPKPLLFHARDSINDIVEDTPEVRRRGWRRVQLFGLFFMPDAIDIDDVDTAFQNRRPDLNPEFAGIYPWTWARDDKASFNAIAGGLLVAPILQKLILNRNPIEVLDFANQVAQWPIERIIPAHLKNNLKYSGKDYRKAFSFLDAGGTPAGLPKPLEADFKALADAEEGLLQSGAIARCPPLPGGMVSREDILAQTVYGCRSGICGQRSEP